MIDYISKKVNSMQVFLEKKTKCAIYVSNNIIKKKTNSSGFFSSGGFAYPPCPKTYIYILYKHRSHFFVNCNCRRAEISPKIVSLEWIVESMKRGQKVAEKEYIFPPPGENPNQPEEPAAVR